MSALVGGVVISATPTWHRSFECMISTYFCLKYSRPVTTAATPCSGDWMSVSSESGVVEREMRKELLRRREREEERGLISSKAEERERGANRCRGRSKCHIPSRLWQADAYNSQLSSRPRQLGRGSYATRRGRCWRTSWAGKKKRRSEYIFGNRSKRNAWMRCGVREVTDSLGRQSEAAR